MCATAEGRRDTRAQIKVAFDIGPAGAKLSAGTDANISFDHTLRVAHVNLAGTDFQNGPAGRWSGRGEIDSASYQDTACVVMGTANRAAKPNMPESLLFIIFLVSRSGFFREPLVG